MNFIFFISLTQRPPVIHLLRNLQPPTKQPSLSYLSSPLNLTRTLLTSRETHSSYPSPHRFHTPNFAHHHLLRNSLLPNPANTLTPPPSTPNFTTLTSPHTLRTNLPSNRLLIHTLRSKHIPDSHLLLHFLNFATYFKTLPFRRELTLLRTRLNPSPYEHHPSAHPSTSPSSHQTAFATHPSSHQTPKLPNFASSPFTNFAPPSASLLRTPPANELGTTIFDLSLLRKPPHLHPLLRTSSLTVLHQPYHQRTHHPREFHLLIRTSHHIRPEIHPSSTLTNLSPSDHLHSQPSYSPPNRTSHPIHLLLSFLHPPSYSSYHLQPSLYLPS